jgi:hypothetical protein
MAISTSTELRTALVNWLNRPDLAARCSDIIALVEARLNRTLRVRAMEATLASTALTDGAVTLPDGFLAFKELRYDSAEGYTLEPRPLEWIRSQPTQATAPLYFAVSGSEVLCWPTSGSVTGTYYTAIPSLNDNESNWLLTSHPDLYLFACLAEAGMYVRDAALMQSAGARAQALLEEVQGADNANAIGGGPLTVRAR